MSTASNKGAATQAQPLLKKQCVSCGAAVFGRTMHRQYCDNCKTANKRQSWRRAADKQRRQAGVPKVKGEPFSCEECGGEFIATSKSRAKFCPTCRPIIALRTANKHSKRRGANDRRRERFNEWYRNRRVGDPLVALSRAMRSLMHREVGKKSAKRGSWYTLVGYTAEELRNHLERQFLPGMTWDNRGIGDGKWHIDHIVPVSAFNYDSPGHPDFKACWALTNLRPMWGADNIKKSARRLYLV